MNGDVLHRHKAVVNSDIHLMTGLLFKQFSTLLMFLPKLRNLPLGMFNIPVHVVPGIIRWRCCTFHYHRLCVRSQWERCDRCTYVVLSFISQMGVMDHEAAFLRLVDKLTNGTKVSPAAYS